MELLFPLLILALLVPMFLGIRRQKKEMAKTTELQDSLNIGDRVMTTAGLHATVAALGDTTVDLEIAPGVVTTWARMVVRERVADDVADEGAVVDADGDESALIDETPEQTQHRLDKE
ncbi:preprotein translocase subunit YajC [Rhodococcus olei]|uniref:Preprotein translocase subunit YajC n=1 Tax=Rhodococcus olei TaxID=2161675 RepID=A0ABP8NW56_9NOCA